MKKWKKPKLRKIILIAAITGGLVGGVVVPRFFNNSNPGAAAEIEGEAVTVQQGDITIDISAAGNLSYSVQEDLAFEMAGTVEEVLVEVGDPVEEGQVIARLDSSDCEDQLTAANNNLLQAEINVRNAEIALDKAKNPYTEEEIEEAEDELRMAEDQLRYDLKHGPESSVLQSHEKVYQLQKRLDEMEEAADEDDIEIKEMQLSLAEALLENAKDEVEKALDPKLEVVAPFDGFITWVNPDAEGGDEVLKGTVAVQIADPTRFEVELLVNEADIYDVEIGDDVSVQVDATTLPDLPAKVTYISPTAVIQSGVVNYEVTVEVESLDIVRQQQQEAMQILQEETQQDLSADELPTQMPEAVDQVQYTQEQVEKMAQQTQKMREAVSEQIPVLIPEDFKLKEGLSVTTNILIEEVLDVVLVPNQAITYSGMEAYVQVMVTLTEDTPMVEERLVQTGINDLQYTEVTDGLSEGEQVIIPQQSDTSTPTVSQDGSQGQWRLGSPRE
jgi:HlyD family secretion protein